MSDQDRVIIFDTTLRDAEQTPGSSLTVREKMEIAHQLARLKVDVIEAGFPASSNEDFEAVRRIAHEIEGPVVCGLARVVPRDIERAGESLQGAPRPRIHTFVGTSDINLQGQLRKSRDEVLKMAVGAIEQAKSYCEDVEFSPMDATRTDPEYLCEVVEAAIAAGATTINIPDTVGYAVPEQMGELIRRLRERVANIDRAVISIHCHDDLGLAVANSLAALKYGARQAECTINGLGERAGNAALEELVMAIKVRGDYFGLQSGVETRELFPTSRLVSRLMRSVVPRNKAVIGANAFAHSSGIHQDGVLKQRSTFEIMSPEDVGVESTQIVLTARSGRHALRHRLEQLGHTLSKEEVDKAYERFLEVADKKTEIYDEDLLAIVGDEIRDVPEKYRLEYLHTTSGTGTVPSATVRLVIGDQTVQESAWGDGPVDAAYRAIDKATGTAAKVEEYAIRAVTSGSQAMGEVTVQVKEQGRTFTGRGASTDIIEASAKAYIDALNRLAAAPSAQRQRPQAV
jgi:2-isopropylmalate synthase